MVKQKVVEALVILLVSAVLAIFANELRSDSLPVIREKVATSAGNDTAMAPTISLMTRATSGFQ